jgi:KaiC/GvpD/RAD55 family RecA-like ATPase
MNKWDKTEKIEKEEKGIYGIGEPDLKSIYTGSQAIKKAPKIYGIPTGVNGLDELFFIVISENGKLVKKNLGGIPAYSVFNITGVSDTGKSLMVEQFAVKQASLGEKVAFITVESPANFVVTSLKLRASAMGLKFEDFEDNIILIDAASSTRLRENIPDLLATLAYVIQNYKVNYTIIDSITGLFETKEMLARSIVRAKLYKKEVGEIVRLFRIDGCRMCGHDTKTHFLEITEEGLVVIKDPISNFK